MQMMQIWDHSFKNLESAGKVLIDAGVLRLCDLEAFIKNSRNPKIKWVAVGLNSYSTLKHLLASAKSGTVGLLLRKWCFIWSFYFACISNVHGTLVSNLIYFGCTSTGPKGLHLSGCVEGIHMDKRGGPHSSNMLVPHVNDHLGV